VWCPKSNKYENIKDTPIANMLGMEVSKKKTMLGMVDGNPRSKHAC
jgi:hypothetical protein